MKNVVKTSNQLKTNNVNQKVWWKFFYSHRTENAQRKKFMVTFTKYDVAEKTKRSFYLKWIVGHEKFTVIHLSMVSHRNIKMRNTVLNNIHRNFKIVRSQYCNKLWIHIRKHPRSFGFTNLCRQTDICQDRYII